MLVRTTVAERRGKDSVHAPSNDLPDGPVDVLSPPVVTQDIILWRIAGWIALVLAIICFWQLASAMDGVHVPHLIGWAEGFPCSLAAAYSCRDAANADAEVRR
jgi:hypothetical protein